MVMATTGRRHCHSIAAHSSCRLTEQVLVNKKLTLSNLCTC